jgi:hypothetical protein
VILHTASEVVSLAKKLETDLADFYEAAAVKSAGDAEALLIFASEDRRNAAQVERAYYSAISDIIEGTTTFKLDAGRYEFPGAVGLKAATPGVLVQVIEMERRVAAFYADAATQSKSLMTDIARVFLLLARKHAARLDSLKTLGGGL